MTTLLAIVFWLVLYMLPTILAAIRRKPDIGMIAFMVHQPFTLMIVGGVFVMEAGSVILQVGSFKLRKQRIFKMSPIHHHFELKGWPESRVVTRFWIIGILFALMSLTTFKVR